MPLCGTEEESARLVEQPLPIPGHWYISAPAPQAIRGEEPTACSHTRDIYLADWFGERT